MMKIKQHSISLTGEILYSIQFKEGCPLAWKRVDGNRKPAEFRCGESISDVFWIREAAGNQFKIGYDDCGLTWSDVSGDTKPAEFRCGEDGEAFNLNGWSERSSVEK